MEIKFQGQYDRRTFTRAVRLANQPPRNQARFVWFMLLFAVGALVLMVYRVIETRDLGGNAVLLGAAALMSLAVGWVAFRPDFIALKMWANPGTRRELKGTVSNRGIIYELREGRNEIRWERFNRVRVRGEIVSLVRRDGLLVVFPRRFFKRDSDWRKFLKLVESKIER